MASTSNNVQSNRQAQRLDFRTTRDGVVPSSIGLLNRLTLDAATKAALTHAGAKLVIEIDPGGTRVLLADGRTNQLIGGPEDLQKLGSIRTFVNRERKDAAGVESAKEVTQLAFLAEQVVKEHDPGFVMKPVDSSYGAAVRPLHAALEQMFENLKKLDDNTSVQQRSVYEPEIRRLFTGIGNAYTETISALTRGETLKGVLSEHLFAEGVPDWVHSRFVSKTFVLERTGELGKLFFPADPTKGLALSIKEWRNKDFVEKQGPLLQSSVIGYRLVNDDELLFAITGIAKTVSLDNEENPQVAKLLKSKLVAMPLVSSADRVIELGSKSRSGFKFPNPSMDTVTGAISALSTALLRVYSANLQSVDLVGDYYAVIAPHAVNRSEVTPTNNFYVQWGKHEDPSFVWLEAIKGGPENINLRNRVWRWIRTELRLSETASAGKALARALLLEESGNRPTGGFVDDTGMIDTSSEEGKALLLPGVPGRPDTYVARPNKGLALHRALSDTEVPFWNRFQERVFAVRPAKKKQSSGIALTPLTPEGKSLLLRVRKLSPYVAERMHQWLRSFSDERLQRAAVKVTNAEFDDMFSSALADEEEAESVMDWAEQEA